MRNTKMMAADAMRSAFDFVTAPEKLGHGLSAETMGHLTRARAEHPPCQKRPEDGVADARPCGGKAVLEPELPRVADEHHRREVAGAIRERAHPRTDVATAEDEPVDGRGGFAAIHAHADRDGDEHDHQQDLDFHFFPSIHPDRMSAHAVGRLPGQTSLLQSTVSCRSREKPTSKTAAKHPRCAWRRRRGQAITHTK